MRPIALLAALSLVLLAPVGCGHRVAPSAPKAKPAAKRSVPLPSWAPKNPSKEFLRAAKVLRPMGATVPPLPEAPQTVDDLAGRAFDRHYHRTLVATWELFGTLDDRQVARFLSTKQIRIPVKSLTKRQRELLERYFAVWRQEMKGLPERESEWSRDWLVELYKGGAREDLSNVLLTFQVRAGSRVAMILYVIKPDGTLSHPFPAGIADVEESTEEKGKR